MYRLFNTRAAPDVSNSSSLFDTYSNTAKCTRDNIFRDGEDQLTPEELCETKKQAPHPLIPIHASHMECCIKKLHYDNLDKVENKITMLKECTTLSTG